MRGNFKYKDDFERLLTGCTYNEITGCLIWKRKIQEDGYGILGIGSRTDGSRRCVLAHRFMYELFYGKQSKELEIDHLCRNRACIEITHLDAVPQHINRERSYVLVDVSFRPKYCFKGHLMKRLPDKHHFWCHECNIRNAKLGPLGHQRP